MKNKSFSNLIVSTFKIILSFGLIFNSYSSNAGLKEQYSSQNDEKNKCTYRNSQYRRTYRSIPLCIIDNILYLENYGKISVMDKKVQSSYIRSDGITRIYTLVQYVIEGNKIVKYECKGYGSCDGSIERVVYGEKWWLSI